MEKVKKSLAGKHANTSEPPLSAAAEDDDDESSTFQPSSERANKFVSEHEQRRRRRNFPGEEELKEAQNSDHSDSALMRLGRRWRGERSSGEAGSAPGN